ncbi:hypothetical protein BOQ62_22590, partial [Chryseobacterium sp. CH21]|uniref:asparagine synthase-related protein n=1 Tax=Chryseobacterium sp. CH21 TaxID=713556 RepID=UPI0010286A45
NSLEVRTPFLDLDFAEFCIQLPDQLKLNDSNDKIILREAMGSYWTETIMVKSDRMAMANSLEVRTPFLDLDFAEFCIQLPDQLKLNDSNDK